MATNEEYIFYRKNGKLMRFSKKDNTTLFRGLNQKYDPDYDKSKLDNPNGYESWTDSYDLAKEYAGEDGYVYSVEVPNKDLNTEDVFDENGDRSLVYWNDKPVALHGVEGEEFMLYTDHDDHNKLDYKEISSPSKDKVEVRDKENSTDMSDLDEGFTIQEQTGYKVFLNGKEMKLDKDNKRKQNAEMKKSELVNKYKNAKTVSDDWFTEEARLIGMTDEEIADHIYERKGARAQDSSDNNIKRILAKKEKEKWEKKVEDYKKLINDPKADESDRIFAQKELKNVQFEADQFKRYEEEYSNRINNSGISDIKLKDMLNRLSKTDRLEKVKMLRELGLNYNTTQRSDQQLYMILLKELNKRLK